MSRPAEQANSRSAAEAAQVIARLRAPGQPPAGQPTGLDQVAAAVLAHLAVLDGCKWAAD